MSIFNYNTDKKYTSLAKNTQLDLLRSFRSFTLFMALTKLKFQFQHVDTKKNMTYLEGIYKWN